MTGRYPTLVSCAASLGLRFGELAGLKIGRLDLMRGRLDVVETPTDVNGHLIKGTPKSPPTRRRLCSPQRGTRSSITFDVYGHILPQVEEDGTRSASV